MFPFFYLIEAVRIERTHRYVISFLIACVLIKRISETVSFIEVFIKKNYCIVL